MQVIKPPQPLPRIGTDRTVFLAGSIEMGAAQNWQQKAERLLKNSDWIIFNPRRDNWDASWEQNKNNPEFYNQVRWELAAMEMAAKIILYFDPLSKAPVSLLELGLFGKRPGKMVVVCPEGFWRKGNIDIVCEKYSIAQANSLEKAVDWLG